MMMSKVLAALVTTALILVQGPGGVRAVAAAADEPANSPGQKSTRLGTDSGDVDDSTSAMRPLIERYAQDRETLRHLYNTPMSARVNKRFAVLYNAWIGELRRLDFERLDHESQIDYLLFENHLRDELRLLDLRVKRQEEMAPLLPFAKTIVELDEARLRKECRTGRSRRRRWLHWSKRLPRRERQRRRGCRRKPKQQRSNPRTTRTTFRQFMSAGRGCARGDDRGSAAEYVEAMV
jgi:uncharacterized protein (DUF885 family)